MGVCASVHAGVPRYGGLAFGCVQRLRIVASGPVRTVWRQAGMPAGACLCIACCVTPPVGLSAPEGVAMWFCAPGCVRAQAYPRGPFGEGAAPARILVLTASIQPPTRAVVRKM